MSTKRADEGTVNNKGDEIHSDKETELFGNEKQFCHTPKISYFRLCIENTK